MEFTAEWSAFVIAALALAQPWVIGIWKKFYRKPKIEFHESGLVEIGYANYGPTLALLGTFRAIHGDVYIKSVEISAIRKKNQATYTFNWFVFRSTRINMVTLRPAGMSLPSGFLISPSKPENIHIAFNDKQLFEEIKAVAITHNERFESFKDHYFSELPGYSDANYPDEILTKSQKESLVESALRQRFHTEYYGKLDRMFYWDPGDYRLVISVKTSDESASFKKEFSFTISPDESQALKLNSVLISELAFDQYLGKPEPTWHFSQIAYTQ
jgi:hypothetical protein